MDYKTFQNKALNLDVANGIDQLTEDLDKNRHIIVLGQTPAVHRRIIKRIANDQIDNQHKTLILTDREPTNAAIVDSLTYVSKQAFIREINHDNFKSTERQYSNVLQNRKEVEDGIECYLESIRVLDKRGYSSYNEFRDGLNNIKSTKEQLLYLKEKGINSLEDFVVLEAKEKYFLQNKVYFEEKFNLPVIDLVNLTKLVDFLKKLESISGFSLEHILEVQPEIYSLKDKSIYDQLPAYENTNLTLLQWLEKVKPCFKNVFLVRIFFEKDIYSAQYLDFLKIVQLEANSHLRLKDIDQKNENYFITNLKLICNEFLEKQDMDIPVFYMLSKLTKKYRKIISQDTKQLSVLYWKILLTAIDDEKSLESKNIKTIIDSVQKHNHLSASEEKLLAIKNFSQPKDKLEEIYDCKKEILEFHADYLNHKVKLDEMKNLKKSFIHATKELKCSQTLHTDELIYKATQELETFACEDKYFRDSKVFLAEYQLENFLENALIKDSDGINIKRDLFKAAKDSPEPVDNLCWICPPTVYHDKSKDFSNVIFDLTVIDDCCSLTDADFDCILKQSTKVLLLKQTQ